MQEFMTKKLAEVQAFVDLGASMLKRADKTFTEQAPEVAETLASIDINLQKLVQGTGQSQIFKAKQERTTSKLTTMMDLYIGNKWDDPVEVLEWLSFYAGSAAAHAALVCSVLDSASLSYDPQVRQLPNTYIQLLDEAITTLRHLGATKAPKQK